MKACAVAYRRRVFCCQYDGQQKTRFQRVIVSADMVPTEGFEPPHLAAHGPEPCASTNSATWAFDVSAIIQISDRFEQPVSQTENSTAETGLLL